MYYVGLKHLEWLWEIGLVKEAAFLKQAWEESSWISMKNIDTASAYAGFLQERKIGFIPLKESKSLIDRVFSKRNKKHKKSDQQKLEL